jgi:hypothetical protein
MNPTQEIFKPFDEGDQFVVLRGRNVFDLTTNPDGRITPIIEEERAEAFKRGLILLEYSRSEGLSYDASELSRNETQDIDNVLHQFNIQNSGRNHPDSPDDEFSVIMRGLLKLVQANDYPKFRDGKPMAFMLKILFAENNCPEMQTGFHSENQIMAIELASKLSKSIGLRKSGCYVLLCEEREGSLDSILTRDVRVVRLSQPDKDEKGAFLEACKNRYPNASLAEDLSDQAIVNITANTPNRSLEKLFFASEKTGNLISPIELFEKKQEDIVQISEGTLEAVDFNRISSNKLVGRTIQRPLEIISRATNAIKEGKKTAIRNMMLCGAPSTGKTDLAIRAAKLSEIQAFMLNSPKSGIVGESERKAKLMLNNLREQHGIGIIDELELVLPMNRNVQAGDGGVTANLMGQLQSFLSDSSLAGKVALIATSNKPGAVSAAMASRWIVLPVLMPVKEDYPEIMMSLIIGLNPEFNEIPNSPDIIEAAEAFFYAGASPREIRDSLVASMALIPGDLGIDHVIFASKDKIPAGNRISYIHSDLMAIKFCTNYSFLPWWNIQTNSPDPSYPFPDYIKKILDNDLLISQDKLDKYIREIEPFANV